METQISLGICPGWSKSSFSSSIFKWYNKIILLHKQRHLSVALEVLPGHICKKGLFSPTCTFLESADLSILHVHEGYISLPDLDYCHYTITSTGNIAWQIPTTDTGTHYKDIQTFILVSQKKYPAFTNMTLCKSRLGEFHVLLALWHTFVKK